MDGYITGSLVLRSVQQGQQFKIRQRLLPSGKLFHSLPAQVIVIRLLSQLNSSINILQTGLQRGKRLHPVFQGIHLRHQRPCGILVIPEIRGAHAFIQFGYSLLNAVQVKDSSRARKDGYAGQPCRPPRDLQRYGDPCAGTYHELPGRKRAKCRFSKSSSFTPTRTGPFPRIITLRTLNKTAPLPQEEHLTGNEYFRNQAHFPISMPHGKNSRQKPYFIPLPYITVFCPSPSFRNVARPSISPASHKRARSHATWRNFPLHPQKGGSGRT